MNDEATGSTLALAILRTEAEIARPVTALRLTMALAADFCALDTTTFLAIALASVPVLRV